MVRNWQARVEQADVRRKQAKQKKQLSEDKKLWKQWIHDCMKHQLDQNVPQIRQLVSLDSMAYSAASAKTSDMDQNNHNHHVQLNLQIWTDTKPSRTKGKSSTTAHADDDPKASNESKNKRLKSKSVGDFDNDDYEQEDGVDEDTGTVTPQSKKKGQRHRSNSSGGGGNGSGTGGSLSSTKKKVHPRSKEAMMSMEQVSSTTTRKGGGDDDDEDEYYISMCRSYFFTGNCPLIKKKNACRYIHPIHSSHDTNRTLHDALMTTTPRAAGRNDCGTDPESQLQKSARAEMIAAERTATINTTIAAAAISSPPNTAASNSSSISSDAATATNTVDPIVVVGAMNMAYYIEVPILFDISTNDDIENGMLPSEQISKIFVQQNLFLGNIVYMAMNGTLIFDRYQDGMLYASPQEFLYSIFGEQAVNNVILCKRDRYSMDPNDVALLEHMPTILLEHICSYLPDESVVAMAQVCRSWYNEFGRPNAPLWKVLLTRRDWPYDDCTDSDQETEKRSYRAQFHQHYVVMRDIQALNKMCGNRPRVNGNGSPAVAVFDYSSRSNISYGIRISIDVWSPRHVLLSYSEDCAIRLFESSQKITTEGDCTYDRRCRELICYRVNPYRNTRKKSCTIHRLVLDDKFITALCKVNERSSTIYEEILVTITRDNFLLGESDTVESETSRETVTSNPLQVFHFTDAILNFMRNDPIDRQQRFEDLDEHHLSFSTHTDSMSSCGAGRILMTVHMHLEVDNDLEHDAEYLRARLFLISTTAGEILWSNRCYPLYADVPIEDPTFTNTIGSNASYLHKGIGRHSSNAACDFAVVSTGANHTIMVGKIDSSGNVSSFDVLPSSSSTRPVEALNNDQSDRFYLAWRNIVFTSSGIAVSDMWVDRGTDDSSETNRTVVSFYPMACLFPSRSDERKGDTMSEVSVLTISENLVAHNVVCVHNDYLIFMCEKCSAEPSDLPWISGKPISVIVHIPSRRQIGTFTWNMICASRVHPSLVSNGQGSLVMEAVECGVIMTGDDIRYYDHAADGFGSRDGTVDPPQLESSTRKKKKKAVRVKKDSFRTHNGDRCY